MFVFRKKECCKKRNTNRTEEETKEMIIEFINP